jgi:hypothetical protein
VLPDESTRVASCGVRAPVKEGPGVVLGRVEDLVNDSAGHGQVTDVTGEDGTGWVERGVLGEPGGTRSGRSGQQADRAATPAAAAARRGERHSV